MEKVNTINKIIVLVGQSATGKTTVEKALGEKGVHRAVSYSTRPMRSNEQNGVDYHFITNEEFDELFDNNKLYERAEYTVNGEVWKYGLGPESFKDGCLNVVTVNPYGLQQLAEVEELKSKLSVFYLHSPESLRIKRYLERETSKDKERNLKERLKVDYRDFVQLKGVEKSGLPYKKIYNFEDTTIEEIVDQILEEIKREHSKEKIVHKINELANKNPVIEDLTFDIIDGNHLDSIWYGGEVLSFKYRQYLISLNVRGDVWASLYNHKNEEIRKVIDKNNWGRFYEEFQDIIKSDSHLYEMCCEESQLKVELHNNNWIEYNIYSINEDQSLEFLENDLLEVSNVLEGIEYILENVENFINEYESKLPEPVVGMGCTVQLGTDRHAYTIIKKSASNKTIWIQRDKPIRLDENFQQGPQIYAYERDLNGKILRCSLRKNLPGYWTSGKVSFQVSLGIRDEFFDYTF